MKIVVQSRWQQCVPTIDGNAFIGDVVIFRGVFTSITAYHKALDKFFDKGLWVEL